MHPTVPYSPSQLKYLQPLYGGVGLHKPEVHTLRHTYLCGMEDCEIFIERFISAATAHALSTSGVSTKRPLFELRIG